MKLVKPELRHKEQAMDYLEEMRRFASPMNGMGSLEEKESYEAWLEFMKSLESEETLPKGYVPGSEFFLMDGNETRVYGMVNLRHRLNDYLLRKSGNIGYSVRPTERRKGYASLQLRLALEKCRELGIKRALVTCDKDNIGSAKTILSCGGVLENEIIVDYETSEIVQRYWIEI